MQFTRREFLQIAGVTAGAGLLAACAPKATAPAQPAQQPAAAEPAAEKPAAAKEAVKLRFMWRLNNDENAFVDAAIAQFATVRPDITVEPLYIDSKQFDVMYAAGDAPDALGTGPNSHVEQYLRKQILPLQDYAEKTEGLLDDIYPVARKAFTWEGKLYCLVQVLYYGGTFCNKSLFEEAGITPPPVDWNAAGWNWDDMLEAARKLTKDTKGDGKTDQYGLNLGHWSPQSYTRYWGQDLITKEDYESAIMRKWRLDEPAVREACINGLQARADAMNVEKVMPTPDAATSLSEMGPMLKTGAVAMDIGGGWIVRGALPEGVKFVAGVGPKGNDGAGTRHSMVWVDPFKITSTTKNPDQCWDWIYWLAADPKGGVPIQTKMLGLTPGIKSGLDDFLKTIQGRLDMSEADLRTFVMTGIETAVSDTLGHILVGWEALRPILQAELDPVWKGTRTAKEAVDIFEPLVADQIRKNLEAFNIS